MINLDSPYIPMHSHLGKHIRLTIPLVSEGTYATTASQKVDYTKKSQLYCIVIHFGTPIGLASYALER